MLIGIAEGPPFDCKAALTVGGIRYDAGPTYQSDLREEVLEFASDLAARRPFVAEFGYEPLFNVDFEGDTFVTYRYRPRFRHRWLSWLGSIRVVSKAENITEATTYLQHFADSLEPL